jgi:hypothetical protein
MGLGDVLTDCSLIGESICVMGLKSFTSECLYSLTLTSERGLFMVSLVG